MGIKYCALIFAFFFTTSLTISASDKPVSIGVANFPPYSIVDKGKITGAEVEIIKQSLSAMGYQPTFVSYPYGRLPSAFRDKKIDGTIVTLKEFQGFNVFYSEIVLPEYQTVAVHLADRNIELNTVKDLKNRSIIAHQRAHLFYGSEYNGITRLNKKTTTYKETKSQDKQVMMLFKERVDVIVLAYEIFIYYKNLQFGEDEIKAYKVSKIFGEKFGFHNAFWQKQVRDDFNEGLKIIKENGTYDKILRTYLVGYKPNLAADE